MPHPSKLEPKDEHLQILAAAVKSTYKTLYEAIQPIPYIRDRLYCVDKIFIEGGSEVLVGEGPSKGKSDSWVRLESYKDIYTDPPGKPVRIIIQADPGFGKTTQTLQYTFDWSTGVKGSPIEDVQLLIYLRMRQLRGVRSLAVAIRRYLVPEACQLTSADIIEILENNRSVAIILDGWDEYPEQDTELGCFMRDIITARAFPYHDVTLTTRYLPKELPMVARRVQLTGFDEQARVQYIRKAVVGDDNEAIEQIKQRLKDNPVLADLCHIPLFFVMFAHLAHEKEEFERFRSVTEFFSFMIQCFHDHLRNKEEDRHVEKHSRQYEGSHEGLSALAYEGLSKPEQQIVWKKEEFIRRLGEGFYDYHKRIGMLIEEEVITDQTTLDASDVYRYSTEIRFYHKLFCEWFAAYRLAELTVILDGAELSRELEKLDPDDLQYLLRFACGLQPIAGKKIISYLQSKGRDTFAVLCILEKTGKVDDIKETIGKLCSKRVEIRNSHTKLLQRSNIQLLEIASSHKIPITGVYIGECSAVADKYGSSLTISAFLSLSILSTLQQLVIVDGGRKMSNEDVVGILSYAAQSPSLNELVFCRVLVDPMQLPGVVHGAEEILSTLRSRNVTVKWRTVPPKYLNLLSGQWEQRRKICMIS